MSNQKLPFQPNQFYHIYNRANGADDMFTSTKDNRTFLGMYLRYVMPIASLICYCHMPNHFHWIVQIRSTEILKILQKTYDKEEVPCEQFISRQFANFFSAYAKYFNRNQNRQGSLFNRGIKRKRIADEEYLLQLVRYIHLNPVKAGIVDQCSEWPYSSYASLLERTKSYFCNAELIESFGGKEEFIQVHQEFDDNFQFDLD